MFLRRLCFLAFALSTGALCSSVRGQSVLHYSFKPGERLKYHYKVSSTVDAMRRSGGYESVTDFEADPEWDVESVSMAGETAAVLTMKDRSESYRNGHRRMNFLHFTPQSKIEMDRSGTMLYGHILVDDTERSLTKKYIGKIPGLRLLSDFDALFPHFERLWYTFDTAVHLDTLGTPLTVRFDSTSSRPFEYDTMVYGRLDTFLTSAAIPYPFRQKGQTTYTLRDSVVDQQHVWALDAVTDEETSSVLYPDRRPNEAHRSSILIFRKKDGLLQSWHYTLENHNGSVSSNSEMWLTMISIEGE